MTKIKKEREILNVIIHLISSSRLIIDEPKEYGTMRLVTAASYISKYLENNTYCTNKKLLKNIQDIDTLVSRNLFDKPEKLKTTLDELSIKLANHINTKK